MTGGNAELEEDHAGEPAVEAPDTRGESTLDDTGGSDPNEGHRKSRSLSPAATVARLRARLMRQFRLVEMPIDLPRSGLTYRIWQPAAIDPLLDAAAEDPEENLPYWATTWPSGMALADVVLAWRDRFEGRRVLELGCGLGITATAVLAAGARLVVTDYAREALLLCRLNTLQNVGRAAPALPLNWRSPQPALLRAAGAPFPEVLAADVLYEARDVEPLLDLIEHVVAPGGTLWLAEPGRLTAQHFLQAAAGRGWHDDSLHHAGPWTTLGDAGVVVHIHRLHRGEEE